MDETNQILEPVDITPEDSVVPIFLIPFTEEQELEIKESVNNFVGPNELLEQKTILFESATEKLKKLGLTIDEIQAVIGIN